MRLSCGTKVRFPAQRNRKGPALNPRPAALGKLWRLRYLWNSQQALIELARDFLHPCRHGELHVFNGNYWHTITCCISALLNTPAAELTALIQTSLLSPARR